MNITNFIKTSVSVLLVILAVSFSNSVTACEQQNKEIAKQQLNTHSLVVVKDGRTSVYDGRGIKPVVDYLEKDNFDGAFVADKVIGKASALLLVYGKVQEVYTPVISKPAVKVFEDNNVKYSADKIVDNIINRTGTDLCPMEKKVQNIDNPKRAYKLFRKLLKES